MSEQSSTETDRHGCGYRWDRGAWLQGEGMGRAKPSSSGPSADPRSTPRQEGSHLRVSDSDRSAVAQELSEHFEAGRLDLDEFQERTARALSARTRDDFTGLFSDLPPLRTHADARQRRPRTHWWFLAPAIVALAVVLSDAGVVAGARHGVLYPWFLIPVGVFVVIRFRQRRRHAAAQAS